MRIEIDVAGEIAERQELLNGTETVSLEGRSVDDRWALSTLISWNIGLESNAGEGDITLARDDGAELFGTLIRSEVTEIAGDGEPAATHEMRLDYVIDGGDGGFESATGACQATGSLAAATFHGTWTITLDPAGVESRRDNA